MALRNIIQKINQEIEKEIQIIKEQTEVQIKEVLAQAEKQAIKIHVEALENFRIEKIKEAKLILKENKNESYKLILDKKKEILDNIFEQALAELKNSNTEKLITRLKKDLPKNGECTEDKNNGFKFISGTLEIDNTFPVLISEARSKLETQVARILF
ncbi:MAG: hypothetical protein COX44_02430 [Candidatus Portnoybacteria bacterium CG23_combo_of_CG06-09_8_20_14_all_37_13]|uniref:V-type proton ATPase subunit E n=1 Tax=Candidatus Portnoybacteria bacterium CG23_combo_of_CG06-09_8_20_14_all_37_13 TaxID=1974819 RepID=A0A2G9YCM4_9BACT|nr:MAG: hypothetical protein COX44_02430 [Candidatus Portnoybacteria bacterium CG23_combo_of_CG06-09_8_20_14_all_37_13]